MFTPMFIPVILVSLMMITPQLVTTNQLHTSTVHGFWEDLFGTSEKVSVSEEVSTHDDSCINPTNEAIYADFDGIDGESTDDNHDKWVDILSFSFNLHKPSASVGATRRRGDVVLEDIILVKRIDKATPKLQEAVAMGRVIAVVEIEFTKRVDGMEVTYLRYELKNVMVTSYQSTVDACGLAYDNLTLNSEEVKVTYTEIDDEGYSKGNVEWSWKVEEGES
jgi:type VI secretion system secreted protein Hcp